MGSYNIYLYNYIYIYNNYYFIKLISLLWNYVLFYVFMLFFHVYYYIILLYYTIIFYYFIICLYYIIYLFKKCFIIYTLLYIYIIWFIGSCWYPCVSYHCQVRACSSQTSGQDHPNWPSYKATFTEVAVNCVQETPIVHCKYIVTTAMWPPQLCFLLCKPHEYYNSF